MPTPMVPTVGAPVTGSVRAGLTPWLWPAGRPRCRGGGGGDQVVGLTPPGGMVSALPVGRVPAGVGDVVAGGVGDVVGIVVAPEVGDTVGAVVGGVVGGVVVGAVVGAAGGEVVGLTPP
jgi:hypothetical protein